MVRPGDTLELDFPVKVVRDSIVHEVRFKDLLGRRTIVSVHMKNNTPSCDRQVASLVGSAAEFAEAGYEVLGLSRDTAGSHARYAAAKGISFPLVSDPTDQFARAADSLVQKTMYGRQFVAPARAIFVLERDGRVLAVAEKADTTNTPAQVRTLLAACP